MMRNMNTASSLGVTNNGMCHRHPQIQVLFAGDAVECCRQCQIEAAATVGRVDEEEEKKCDDHCNDNHLDPHFNRMLQVREWKYVSAFTKQHEQILTLESQLRLTKEASKKQHEKWTRLVERMAWQLQERDQHAETTERALADKQVLITTLCQTIQSQEETIQKDVLGNYNKTENEEEKQQEHEKTSHKSDLSSMMERASMELRQGRAKKDSLLEALKRKMESHRSMLRTELRTIRRGTRKSSRRSRTNVRAVEHDDPALDMSQNTEEDWEQKEDDDDEEISLLASTSVVEPKIVERPSFQHSWKPQQDDQDSIVDDNDDEEEDYSERKLASLRHEMLNTLLNYQSTPDLRHKQRSLSFTQSPSRSSSLGSDNKHTNNKRGSSAGPGNNNKRGSCPELSSYSLVKVDEDDSRPADESSPTMAVEQEVKEEQEQEQEVEPDLRAQADHIDKEEEDEEAQSYGGSSNGSSSSAFQVVVASLMKDAAGEMGTFSGTAQEGMPHGEGRMQYHDGRIYNGKWRHGQWHGCGKLSHANGDMYDGEFDQHRRHGHGVYTWENGNVYTGDFHQDIRQGLGTFEFVNGHIYDGDFVNGEFEGFGRYTFDNDTNDRYEGEFKSGRFEGLGTMITNGRTYTGEFVAGVAHGEGEETGDDGIVKKGHWKRGDFVSQLDSSKTKKSRQQRRMSLQEEVVFIPSHVEASHRRVQDDFFLNADHNIDHEKRVDLLLNPNNRENNNNIIIPSPPTPLY